MFTVSAVSYHLEVKNHHSEKTMTSKSAEFKIESVARMQRGLIRERTNSHLFHFIRARPE